MTYEPKSEDLVDMFLTQHSEERIFRRFPNLRLKNNSFKVYVSYCESPTALPMWAMRIHGGYLIGKFEKSKVGSRIKGIFIAQTALYNWQYKRSRFVPKKFVYVEFRRINSQISNKIKGGQFCNKEYVNALAAVSNMVSDVNRRRLQMA